MNQILIYFIAIILFSCTEEAGESKKLMLQDSAQFTRSLNPFFCNSDIDYSEYDYHTDDGVRDSFPEILHIEIEDSLNIQPRYNASKRAIVSQRNTFASNFDETDSAYNVVHRFLYKSLLDDIIPYWYGTPWDFNGISDKPNQGVIACGYFVSTTLKHMGFNLNRYKVAQQYSLKIIEILCGKENVKTFGDNGLEDMFEYIKSRPEDVYVLGLSCHVGFLSLENDTIYFLHSSYVEPLRVVKEYAEESLVLTYSNIYVVGPLFSNKNLMDKWLSNTFIPVE